MQKQLKAVEHFHNTFKQENGIEPKLISDNDYRLRYKLMDEENKEYLEACEKDDLVGIADALGDKLYILCGTILKHGMQHVIEEVFDEIQRSNMSKVGEDGQAIIREDGKILKGPQYSPPDLGPILENSKQPVNWKNTDENQY